jgi:hypothetical protein
MLACLAVAWLLAIGTTPARATVVRQLSLEELTLGADAIVHGRVVRTGTQGAARGNPMPFSVARIEVIEWIAGDDPQPAIVVREPGARWAGRAVTMGGVPRYREGDEVLVFLARRGPHYRTYGLAQGAFFIGNDADGSQPPPARRRLTELSYLEEGPDGGKLAPAQPDLPAALPALLSTIRTLASYRP